jgi:Domain of unknown function (DUF1877)
LGVITEITTKNFILKTKPFNEELSMSMNLFFVAVTQNDLDEMDKNHKLIDESIDSEKYLFRTDVETAWDVLRHILGGAGILVGKDIDDALFNGCSLISSNEVQAQARELANWSSEQVSEGLSSISSESDLYHLELFQDDEEDLLEQFEKMVAFYKEAAEKGLGAISYAA